MAPTDGQGGWADCTLAWANSTRFAMCVRDA
jgi:hypothetical protein